MNSNWQSAMEAVIDKAFDKKVLERDVPGIGISAVHAGHLYSTSYSFGDRENRRVVEPARSIFHAGTLAHLVTTIAILQLYERGRIDLKEDVNRFLSTFRVINGPLTVEHLLARTDGFEERARAAYAPGIGNLSDPETILAHQLPVPVVRSGDYITYGTWGTALAGYIVEQVSEMPFAKFVDENIFQPMGMTSSSFEYILPNELALRALKTYYEEGGSLKPMPTIYSTLPAADGLSTTVTDVANIMAMLLARGHFNEQQILKETTVEEMLCLRRNHHPSLPGSTFGFMEYREHGKSALICDGVGMGVRCRMFLLPAEDAAVFVIANSSSGNFCELLTSAYVQHFYPSTTPPPKPASNFNFRADRFMGTYQYLHHERRSVSRFDSLRSGVVRVTNAGDGSLKLTPVGPDNGHGGFVKPTRLLMIEEPVVFQREDNGARVAFQEDPNGLITHLYSGSGQLSAYRKMGSSETPQAITGLYALAMLVFATGLGVWGLYMINNTPKVGEGSAYVAGILGALISALDLVFGLGAYSYITRREGGLPAYSYVRPIPRAIRYLFGLGVVNLLLTFVVSMCALLALQYEFWSSGLRVHYLVLTAAAMIFVWVQSKLNLFSGALSPKKPQA